MFLICLQHWDYNMKFSEWQGGAGEWRAADTTTWTPWWYPARILGIEITDYILLLKNKYNARNFRYFPEKNLLIWDWKNYTDCHSFVLYINRMSKNWTF